MPFLRSIFGLRGLALTWVGVATIAVVPSAQAASSAVAQQSVYAAFVVNITRFIQWPDSAFSGPDAPIVIGTFARDPINGELDGAVRGELVGTRPLRTIRIRSLDDLATCHLVYMAGSEPQKQAVLARIAGKPILSISDGDGFLDLGGHVRFVPRPPHTQLRIGLDNLRASGLQARAQLLRIAQAEAP